MDAAAPQNQPGTAPAIELAHLRKVFGGGVVAVDDLSFAVARGSVTGLLGGNGAGKTTTIGMIMGLILPTSGSVRVLGVDMQARPLSRARQDELSKAPMWTCRIG